MSQNILEVRIFHNLLGKAKCGWSCNRFNEFVKGKANIHDLPAATGAGSLTSRLKVPSDGKGREMWHYELKFMSTLLLHEHCGYYEVRIVDAARRVGVTLIVLDMHTE